MQIKQQLSSVTTRTFALPTLRLKHVEIDTFGSTTNASRNWPTTVFWSSNSLKLGALNFIIMN